MAGVYLLSDANFLGWQDQNKTKDLMEILHPSLLASVLALALLGWFKTKDLALISPAHPYLLGKL